MPKDKPAPKKTRWYAAVWQAFQYTRRQDRLAVWLLLGVFVGVVALGYVLGLVFGHPVYALVIAVPFAFLAALFTLTNRFTKAQYAEIHDEVGASRAVLGTVRRGWTFADEPVALDAKTQDLVFRGVGRHGIVLVGEARTPKVKRLLTDERRKLNRILKDVPVTVIEVGDREGQVPLGKLVSTVQKLKPQLTRAELAEVEKRLTALGTARLPIPKGVDPNRARIDRRGAR